MLKSLLQISDGNDEFYSIFRVNTKENADMFALMVT